MHTKKFTKMFNNLFLLISILFFAGANSFNSYADFKGNVLGLRLTSLLPEEEKDEAAIEEELFPNREPFLAFNYGADLLETLLYPSEEGQIRSEAERNNTILLNAAGIAITDFASPKINEVRNEGDLSKLKIQRIQDAESLVKERFGYE
ncbi:MAG TPA: hypothetical protein PKC92_12295 [Bacteroidia bacterium]|nr:hypothetical protein [Bacteroidia bacterium]